MLMSGAQSAWNDAHQWWSWHGPLRRHQRCQRAGGVPQIPDDSAVVAHRPLRRRSAAVRQGPPPWGWDGGPQFGVAVRAAVPGVWIVLIGRHQDAPPTLMTGNGASRMPPRSGEVLRWDDGVVDSPPWRRVGRGDWDQWDPLGPQIGVVWRGELLLTCSLDGSADLLLAWELVWRVWEWNWCDPVTCEPVSRQQEIWELPALVAP